MHGSITQHEAVCVRAYACAALVLTDSGRSTCAQFVREFAKLGLTRSVGGVLALALSRELTPVVTCIILAGRPLRHLHFLKTTAALCQMQTVVSIKETKASAACLCTVPGPNLWEIGKRCCAPCETCLAQRLHSKGPEDNNNLTPCSRLPRRPRRQRLCSGAGHDGGVGADRLAASAGLRPGACAANCMCRQTDQTVHSPLCFSCLIVCTCV